MSIQLIKPRAIGLISKAYGFGTYRLAIGALCFFRLGEETSLLLETEQWPVIGKALKTGQVLDMGFAKPRSEFLLSASAHALDAQPVRQMTVNVSVADKSKSLMVMGDRKWKKGWFKQVSEPAPFVTLPLDYDRAFGGPDIGQNPCGVGSKKYLAGQSGDCILPNLYYPKDSVKPKRVPKVIAGVGPMDITLPQRAKYQGTYDESWLKNQHPGFPLDCDERLFMSGPEDQWLDGYLAPGAEYGLEGVHPRIGKIEGRVPEVRVRAVVQQHVGESHCTYKDIRTHIDTLWFFPEHMLGVAIHRGVVDVNDIDGLDIKQLLLAYEGLNDKPRPAEHYIQQLKARTDPSSAVNALLNEAPLLPQKTPQQLKRRQALIEDAKKQQQQKVKDLLEALGKSHPAAKLASEKASQSSDDMPVVSEQLLADFDFDLAPLMSKVNEVIGSAEKQQKTLHKKAQHLAGADNPQSRPEVQSVESLYHRVHHLPDENPVTESDPGKGREMLQQAAREGRGLSPVNTCTDVPLAPGQALQIGIWVRDLIKKGQPLKGRDLRGVSLAGMDLNGLDMRGVMLECADLTDCSLAGADLTGAVLTEATLVRTDLSHANLSHANLGSVKGKNACFDFSRMSHTTLVNAQLTDCFFRQAKLQNVLATDAICTGADFSKSSMLSCQWIQCQLQNSIWHRSHLDSLVMYGSDISQSDWTHSKLHKMVMVDVVAVGSDWTGSEGKLLQLGPAGKWSDANFNHVLWHTCGFRNLELNRVDAKTATFVECDFSDVKWLSADLSTSTFKGCLMGGMTLTDLNWQDCLLYQSNLRKVNASQVRWNRGEFIQVDTEAGRFDNCDIKGLKHNPPPKHAIRHKETSSE